jgi:hypothetical protein
MVKVRFLLRISLTLIVILFLLPACKGADGNSDNSGLVGGISPSSDNSGKRLNETEAIAIALRYVPAEVANHAKIIAGISGGSNETGNYTHWEIIFMNISITKRCLGWNSDKQTSLGSKEPFNELTVDIDANTGEFISRMASVSQYVGGPGISPPTEPTWVVMCTP